MMATWQCHSVGSRVCCASVPTSQSGERQRAPGEKKRGARSECACAPRVCENKPAARTVGPAREADRDAPPDLPPRRTRPPTSWHHVGTSSSHMSGHSCEDEWTFTQSHIRADTQTHSTAHHSAALHSTAQHSTAPAQHGAAERRAVQTQPTVAR